MDPTPAECNAWATLSEASVWIGMSDDLLEALLEQMGLPKTALFRQVAGIPLEQWNAAVPNVRVIDRKAEVPEGGQAPTRTLYPAEFGFIGTFRRCIRLRIGAPADEGPPPSQQSGPPAAVPGLEALSNLLSQMVSGPPGTL